MKTTKTADIPVDIYVKVAQITNEYLSKIGHGDSDWLDKALDRYNRDRKYLV